jgi:three-Cys-motif partner protein
MPIIDGVGEGPLTQRKLDDFKKIIEMHLNITYNVICRVNAPRMYRYIDLTAGKGYALNPPRRGCAVIFADAIERMYKGQMNYRADFVDEDPAHIESLKTWLAPVKEQYACDDSWWHFHEEQYQSIGPALAKVNPQHQFGLVFVDPNGDAPDIKTLATFANLRPKMEILIYVATTNLKRAPGAPVFSDYLNAIPKTNWLVREKQAGDSQGWTFLLGSRTNTFGNYKKIGFYRIDDPNVQESFQMFDKTQDQLRNERQTKMFPD